ncbi:MAG: DUF748 domain-containing protein [Betaproteobacteria bacterium]|nr:MAG: DUF748 domain-containing protein [Betaproteobacteria bacterium]
MSNAAPQLHRLLAIATSRLTVISLLLVLLYALLGFLAAPWLVRQQLPKLVEQHLGTQASVGDVRINPFLFSFEARDLAIAEKGGLPLLQVDRLFVDLEASSLLRWAWTFREIRIERPVINVDLDANENLNLARVLASLQKNAPEKKEPAGELPRLLLQHFAMSGGAFRFTDHTLQPAARTQVDPINFEIHDVSTLPDHSGEHRLSARLPDGGSLQWQGKLSLSPIESSGSIGLKDARLATPWQFVRDHLTIAEPQGTVHFGVRYRLGYAGGALKFEADDLAFGLKDLVIAQEEGGTVLAKLATVAVEGGTFNLAQRSLDFKEIRVADGALSIILDEDSMPDWAKLVRSNPRHAGPAAKNAPPEDAEKPAAAPWKIALPQVHVGPLALTLIDYSRAKPVRVAAARTELTLGMSASVGEQLQAVVDGGVLKLKDIHTTAVEEKEPPVTVEAAEISGIAVDLQQKTIRAGLARLSGGRTWVRRDATGDLHLVSLFAPRKVQLVKELRKEGFSLAVNRAEIAGYVVALTDQTFQPAIHYDLEQLNATITKVAMPPKNPSPFEMSLRIKQGGTVKAKGMVDLRRPGADVRFEVADVALAPLDTILKRETTLTLASGKAGTSGRAIFDGKGAKPAIRYTGTATVADLDVQTAANSEKLVGWKRVTAADIDFNSTDNRLGVARVTLSEPYARLIVNKDRSTNLAGIKRAAPPAPAETAAGTPLSISIDRVSIDSGSMDFADLGLVLPFATYIQGLGGSVNGLSSAADSRANLKLEGRIDEFGLARAEGTIQPFAPKKFTDIAVAFRNVDLPPMSPYSATFAGRKIASGKISLDLHYKIENSQLAGDNKVVLDKFTLGERVESPTAVNLPLDLAIALLTDSDGKIDLTLPVSGDVDHPEFSYGHVIWQAIRTVITRIVTAPFRALGALFGAGAETLGDIVFDPGSARILPTEHEKLRRVAEGLQKRPQLKLVVQGLYHQDHDGRALRTQAVRADLAAREGLRLTQGEDPGPVGFDSAKTQRALENMLEARAGGDAVAQFVAAFRKTAGREVDRVNPVLAVMGRGAGDRALYVAMHQRLVELQPLPAPALAALARARADAITNAFTSRLRFDPARMGSKPVGAVEEIAKDGVPVKLSFEPMQ